MSTIASIEEVCEAKGITLVMHPILRRALKGHEESFYIGVYRFLRGEANGLYDLPLANGGHVVLLLTRRRTPLGHGILRLEPVARDGLARIKTTLGRADAI